MRFPTGLAVVSESQTNRVQAVFFAVTTRCCYTCFCFSQESSPATLSFCSSGTPRATVPFLFFFEYAREHCVVVVDFCVAAAVMGSCTGVTVTVAVASICF